MNTASETSLHRLSLDKIHFYHMWCVLNLDDFWRIMAPRGPYEGALRAKEEGLIDHICISTHCSGNEIETILGTGAYEGITLGYNLINAEFRRSGIDAALRRGVGVAIMNPLAGGVLPRNAALFQDCCEPGESIIDAVLRFVISTPGVTCALAGAATLEELLEDVRSAEKADAATEERKSSIRNARRFDNLCTGCGYCAGCPAEIEISKLMLAYNQTILMGEDPETPMATLDRMAEWWEIGRTREFPCLKCGACERKCTQHLPIISRIDSINQMTRRNRETVKRYLVGLFGGKTRIGIYGTGALAVRFYEECRDCGILLEELHCYDSNPAKWGTISFFGTEIEPPGQIMDSGVERIIVCVGSASAFRAICNSLSVVQEQGITIVRYEQLAD